MSKLFVWLSIVMLVVTPNYAASKASVNTYCYLEQGSVEGLDISLYKIGDISGSSMSMKDEYVGIAIPDLTSAQSLQACAQAIYARINGSGYKPDFKAAADKEGKASFSNVPYGVYCLVSNRSQSNDIIYNVIPVLVFVDGDTSVDLKMEVRPVATEEKVSVSVQKKWVLSNGSKSTPVIIELLRNGTAVDTVQLDDKSNWSYTWTDLDKDSVWTVVERKVPEGFVAEMSDDGNTFVITNTSIDYLKVKPQTGLGTFQSTGLICMTIAAMAVIICLIIINLKGGREHKQ